MYFNQVVGTDQGFFIYSCRRFTQKERFRNELVTSLKGKARSWVSGKPKYKEERPELHMIGLRGFTGRHAKVGTDPAKSGFVGGSSRINEGREPSG